MLNYVFLCCNVFRALGLKRLSLCRGYLASSLLSLARPDSCAVVSEINLPWTQTEGNSLD